jgi:hypothetical protein
MHVEEYLDIMLPRRKKILDLINRLETEKNGERSYKSLKDEIWRINREVSSSKSLEAVSFVTDLVSRNVGILLGMMLGGILGYASDSFSGCGLGGVVGAGVASVSRLANNKPFKIPSISKRTKEWVEAKIESPQEKLLSAVLAKDIPTIQVYHLRRRLQRM